MSPEPIATRVPLAPHLLEDIARETREAARLTAERRRTLVDRLVGIRRLYSLPEWQAVMDDLRETLAEFRDQLESQQPEAETVFLRGQVRTLRRVLRLPETVAQEIAAIEAGLKAAPGTADSTHEVSMR